MKMTIRWKARAARMRRELQAIALATRDPRTPWYARVLAICVIAYAASPIDLIPDFIPVLGYADDVGLVALALRSVVRRAGAEALSRHWPGDAAGLEVVARLAGLRRATSP